MQIVYKYDEETKLRKPEDRYEPSERINAIDVESCDWSDGSSHQFDVSSHALSVSSLDSL